MENWIFCSLVVFLALSPLESHGQLDGSNYTNILVDRLQVSTNIPLRFYRVRMQP